MLTNTRKMYFQILILDIRMLYIPRHDISESILIFIQTKLVILSGSFSIRHMKLIFSYEQSLQRLFSDYLIFHKTYSTQLILETL